MIDLLRPTQDNYEAVARDIAEKHYKSAFTTEESLVNWIYTALQQASSQATWFERERSEKCFLKYLEKYNPKDKEAGDENT